MLISADEINKSLKNKNWSYNNKKITKLFKFNTYIDGINFVNKVAQLSEKQNHHPSMTISWCSVAITISSHDFGGVTTKCVNLATGIDLI